MLRRLLAAGLVVLASLEPSPRHDAINRPGSLLLVGGGTVSPAVKRQFLDLAGGPQARIVVIPSASYLPEAVQEAIDFWEEEGVRVVVLHTTSREEADRPGFAEPLRTATGVWIPGGDQTRFMAIYGGTAVERELLALYRRGGVIGGTSAGASVASQVMVSAEGEGRGLGLLDRMVVDQHFDTRERLGRLLNVLKNHPDQLGLGLDEETGVVIRSTTLTVVGEKTVTVCRPGFGPAVYHPGDQICLGPSGPSADR